VFFLPWDFFTGRHVQGEDGVMGHQESFYEEVVGVQCDVGLFETCVDVEIFDGKALKIPCW